MFTQHVLLAISRKWQQGANSVCWPQRVTKRVLQVRCCTQLLCVPSVAKLGLSKLCCEAWPVKALRPLRVLKGLCSCVGQAPIKLLFPAAPKLVAAAMQPASAPALATAALAPWLAAKGIRSAQEIDAVAAANR